MTPTSPQRGKKGRKIEDKAWLALIEEFERTSADPWQSRERHRIMSDFVWFLIEKYGIPAKVSFPTRNKNK